MMPRYSQSSTSRPTLDWESAPIIRPGAREARPRGYSSWAMAGAFLLGLMFGLLI